jgi:hypothetical protein
LPIQKSESANEEPQVDTTSYANGLEQLKLLRQASENADFKKNINKYVNEFLAKLKTRHFFREASAMRVLDPKAASLLFEACITNIEDIFLPHLNSYSAMRWFFYFRRLPNVIFEGDLNSTLPNARALIEVYASQSKKYEVVGCSSEGYVFDLDESALRHIARFVAFCNLMYDLQVQYRFANKGFSYRFFPTREVLPRRGPDSEKYEAVKLYDLRHNLPRTFLSAALVQSGLAPNYLLDSAARFESESLICWGLSDENKIRPKDFLNSEHYSEFLVRFGDDGILVGRYVPSSINLSALFDIYRRPSMAMHTLSESAALSLISLLLGGLILSQQPLSLLRVVELGYFVIPHKFWFEFSTENYKEICYTVQKYLPQFAPPVSVEEFRLKVAQYYSSSWPLAHGNPIRSTDAYVCVDMWAASMCFLTSIQFPAAQGKVANERAEKFEDIVQEELDHTPWADPSIRIFRQKTLRFEGKPLTDIDAIGSRNGTLLIISCKSIPYSLAYDKGEHKAIRNAETTIVEAIRHWNNIVEHLKNFPKGENYDFSTFNKVVGVVCTPFVIYTSDAISLTPVFEDLRPVLSLEELAKWMINEPVQ